MMGFLLAVAMPRLARGFSSPSPPPPPIPMRHQSLIFRAATLESASEVPSCSESVVSDLMAPDLPTGAPRSALSPTESIQTRSLDIDKDAIINASILIFAIAVALERILSVDVGITRGWTPTEIAERIPLDNWRSYTNILNMAPLKTKALTSATVYTIGDIIAQQQQGTGIGKLDRWRIGRSFAAGYIGHGPMSHVWYHVSEDFFDNVLNLHAWWDFIPKVVVDQTVFGPIWNNSYILLLGIMQLQRPQQIWEDMKRTTIPLILSGLKLWPFVHCITYGLIPVENRLLWVDAVEIVWVTILASQANSATETSEEDGANI
ncbi:hypothetical protein ACHAWF_009401 [Thalassiosira exigua]